MAITLELTPDEASAVSIALVMLIHDTDSNSGTSYLWRLDASAVAKRLEQARDDDERARRLSGST